MFQGNLINPDRNARAVRFSVDADGPRQLVLTGKDPVIAFFVFARHPRAATGFGHAVAMRRTLATAPLRPRLPRWHCMTPYDPLRMNPARREILFSTDRASRRHSHPTSSTDSFCGVKALARSTLGAHPKRPWAARFLAPWSPALSQTGFVQWPNIIFSFGSAQHGTVLFPEPLRRTFSAPQTALSCMHDKRTPSGVARAAR